MTTNQTKCNKTPVYNYSKWTDNFYTQNSHNCYSYALDDIDNNRTNYCKQILKKQKNKSCIKLRPRPGKHANLIEPRKKRMTCKGIRKGVLADNSNIYKLNSNDEKCKKCYYKIAYAVQPGKTYHFYRQDADGTWSHKDGSRVPTKLDASKTPITDPQTANRKYKYANYNNFCGYLCVPENHYQKTNIKALQNI